MRLIYNEALNKRILPYLEKLVKKKNSLDKGTAILFDTFMLYFNMDTRYSTYSDKLEPCLIGIIKEEEIKSVAHLFDGKLNKLLCYLLGDEYTRLFHTYLKLKAHCPYTYGYLRRSQRSANPYLHFNHVIEALIQFLKLRATGFTVQTILNGGNSPEEIEAYKDSMNCQDWMATQIAEGNQTVIGHLQSLLTCKNYASRLNHGHFQAIAMSGYRPLLESEGKLLSTPKLQEGLRQAIMESMDEGCPESYLYILSVIYDNGLQRFAAVKRGIAVSTGIGEQDSSEHVTNKYIELIRKLLNNRDEAHKALQSKDTTELYLALWSIGFYDTNDIQALASGIIKNGVKYQVLTFLYFLRSTQHSIMSYCISKDALERWHDDPSVVAAILPLYLQDFYFSRYDGDDNPELTDYFDNREEAVRHYEYLKQTYQSVSAKETYEPYIFPWGSIQLTHSELILKMTYITWMLNDSAMKDELCGFLASLDSYMRANCIDTVLNPPDSPLQEEYVLQSLGDRSLEVRNEAYKVLSQMTLSPEQNRKVEELLRFKYGEMRINAIRLLMKQPKEELADSIRRLITDKVAERRLAGLDMMKTIHNEESMQVIFQELLPVIKGIQKPNAKEKALIAPLIGDGTEKKTSQHYTKENGFGLFDPTLEVCLPEITPDKGFNVKKAFEFISFGRAKLTFERLNKYIAAHKNDEFKNYYGETCLVGNSVLMQWGSYNGLSELGRPELWLDFYRHEIGSYEKLLLMSFMLASTSADQDYDDSDEENEEDRKADLKSAGSFEPLVNKMYTGFTYRGLQKALRKLPYYEQMEDIIDALAYEYRDETVYQRMSVNMLLQLTPLLDTKNIFRQYTSKHAWLKDKLEYGERSIVYPIHSNKFVRFWLDMPCRPIDDALFIRYFTVRYQLYKLTNYMQHTPEPEETASYLQSVDFARAWMLGLIPAEEVYRELTGRINSPGQIRDITLALNGNHRLYERDMKWMTYIKGLNFTLFRPLQQKITDRILDIELPRGDSETQVTRLAEGLTCVYGAKTFIRILQTFGKEAFVRENYNWKSTKRGVLSSLLHACYPSATDTSAHLKMLARQAEISDERLVEAAMFAPQWIELTEQATEWKGLTSAAYYFHAHTNETCDNKKKAIIARYTPIDIEDLREGAFDIGWFKDAFHTLGKQRFEVVYNAAKYISCSNSHNRARKFADATNGAVKAADIEKGISAKRNKDLLMSYGLIPLGEKADKELLRRYLFLLKFLKESKNFGVQRQESEKKAVAIALQNLTLNSGYGDITRLIWSMETELLKELLPYLSPKKIEEDIEVYVHISHEGKAEIKPIKAGKELGSMPAKLKRHPYVEELKAVHKKLKDLYDSSRIMLEQAMEDGTRFKENELRKLMQNPVIWPLLKHIVFICNGQIGFYTDGLLMTANGICLPLKPKDELRIAHPTDLCASGNWHTYQQYLFGKAIRQPFKQVFRELYLPTPEEKDAIQSYQYAGNLIQPSKTVAVLKGRRWLADYEDGLQKIYYKENIIATIYIMTDWFSPADIESPILEYVCFHNRRDYRLIKISEVPPIIFSEVMRDVDMAVSAAHIGSITPEASHPTIEMRSVWVELALSLFHLDNVKVNGNFAHIEGELGKYDIHLGSGAIRKEGGEQIALPPIHLQNHKRLLLPFIDEDSKTVDILAKVIFFAEDNKIKDPNILRLIK